MEPEPGTVLYIGRLKKYKGIQYLVRALSLLRRECGGTDPRLVVIGSGDYRPRLERLAESLGIADSVVFTGRVSERDKLEWLTRAWVAAFASEKEGWGLTVIEANACGTSVIASNCDGLRDSVRHGETGFLVPAEGSWSGLSDEQRVRLLHTRLCEVLSTPGYHRRMSAQCLDWAGGFSWERTAARMLEIIEKSAADGL